MVTLDIKVQLGQIGIQHTPFQVDMNIKAPDMILEQSSPDLVLDVTFPQIVEIDQRACFRELGLMDFMDAIRMHAQEGQANALQAIERYTQKGEQLSHLEEPSITVAKVASQTPSQEKQINIDVAPKTRPKITFREGEVNGYLRYGDVNTRLSPGDLGYTFRYGKIKTYIEKEPILKIIPKGLVFDQRG